MIEERDRRNIYSNLNIIAIWTKQTISLSLSFSNWFPPVQSPQTAANNQSKSQEDLGKFSLVSSLQAIWVPISKVLVFEVLLNQFGIPDHIFLNLRHFLSTPPLPGNQICSAPVSGFLFQSIGLTCRPFAGDMKDCSSRMTESFKKQGSSNESEACSSMSKSLPKPVAELLGTSEAR